MKTLQGLAAASLAVCLLVTAPHTHAQAPRIAVFPLELDDTSLQGTMQGRAAADTARLARLAAQLLDAPARSGAYAPVAVPADAGGAELRSCGGCAVERARKLDAHASMVGWVQKVSDLILNINLAVYDVGTGTRLAGGGVDIRGDTDKSWTRGPTWLLRNRSLSSDGRQ